MFLWFLAKNGTQKTKHNDFDINNLSMQIIISSFEPDKKKDYLTHHIVRTPVQYKFINNEVVVTRIYYKSLLAVPANYIYLFIYLYMNKFFSFLHRKQKKKKRGPLHLINVTLWI